MKSSRILCAVALICTSVALFEARGDVSAVKPVACEGTYKHHLQGMCADDKGALYWSFTTTLVKTDGSGKVLKSVPVGNHHGDLCHHADKLYVAVNFGRFNDPKGNADSWVIIYDAKNLAEIGRHKTPEVFHGAGGIAFHDGRFFVVGGLPNGVEENYVYEYDAKFQFTKKHVIKSGHTHLGIQTAAFINGKFWFGCYGSPNILLVTDASFKMLGRHEFNCSLGIEKLGKNGFWVAKGACTKGKGCVGQVLPAKADADKGLVLQAP